MFKKRKKEEGSHSSFMLTYTNLMMLLMTFFIVLVSMGRIQEEKVKIGMYSFREAFFSGGLGMLFGSKKPIDFKYLIQQERIKLQKKISTSLEKTLEKEKKKVEIVPVKEGIALRIPGEILFDLGKAELKPEAKKILDKLVPVFKKYNYPVKVEGHTDNLPIHTKRFPSNWELSAARAINVVKYLEKRGINKDLLSAVGYGEYHPLFPNDTPDHRLRNRRVEIKIAIP